MNKTITHSGGPAFPMGIPSVLPEHYAYTQTGMTLRDWFAGMALSGMMAYHNGVRGDFHTNSDDETIANCAYSYADAMIEARTKTQSES